MREIIVALTNTAGDPAAIAQAALLLDRSTDHLTLIQPAELPASAMGGIGDNPITRMQPAVMQSLRDMDSTTRSLRAIASQLDVPYDIEIEDGTRDRPLEAIGRRAQLFDFCVVACGGPTSAERRKQHAVFAAVAFAAGRPVLAVPERLRLPVPFHRAVLAWSRTRESARAIHDYAHLLPGSRAFIVSVGHGDTYGESGHLLAEFLIRHGRHAMFEQVDPFGGQVANALLDYALEKGADVMVCGAYGHPKTMEWLLGGTTRELLEETHIPILFSR